MDWVKLIFEPRAFIHADSGKKTYGGSLWNYFLVILFTAIIIFISSMFAGVSIEELFVSIFQVIIIYAFYGIVLSPGLSFIIAWISKRFGGKGDYLRINYFSSLISVFLVPLSFVIGLIGGIISNVYFSLVTSVILVLYSLYFSQQTLVEVENVNGKTAWKIILLPIVLIIIIFAVLVVLINPSAA